MPKELTTEQYQSRKFETWRNRVIKHLPEWAARTFALRDKFYAGRGYHYGLEKSLGFVISRANDYAENFHHGVDGIANQIGLEVAVEGLVKALNTAEKSAEHEAQTSHPADRRSHSSP